MPTKSASDALAAVHAFQRAVEARDIATMSEYFEDDAQMFTTSPQYPLRLDGRARIVEHFNATVAQGASGVIPQKIEPYDESVIEFGDVALITFHLRSAGPPNRRSWVMRRRPEGWRIVHIHASTANVA